MEGSDHHCGLSIEQGASLSAAPSLSQEPISTCWGLSSSVPPTHPALSSLLPPSLLSLLFASNSSSSHPPPSSLSSPFSSLPQSNPHGHPHNEVIVSWSPTEGQEHGGGLIFMNDPMPGPAHCRQQPELRRPAGWFASGLCLGMKRPWPAAMLPW